MPEQAIPTDPRRTRERTCFQTSKPYAPDLDLGADVAIVYGVDEGLPERVRSWQEAGYLCHCMTGIAWGEYQDYLYGRWDGVTHLGEAQTDRDGSPISHGGDVYYMCPSEALARYIAERSVRALDAGVSAIHFEEPEFWIRAGYSDAFKAEWEAMYGVPWEAPHSSVDARWRASKLMYHLYGRTLRIVMQELRREADRRRVEVRLYVPTHSLLNYAHWGIVSPESSLGAIEECDGYIGQVWTGTARTPTVYRGERAERTFHTAFCEYGALASLARAAGARLWFLADPVEDDPNHSWSDYRRNWQATVVASLLWPGIWRYEIMPWPERIFRGSYPGDEGVSGTDERVPLPQDYGTELLTVANALTDMNHDDVTWECGTQGIGVLVSDTLMFQRADPHPSDPHLSHFYGIAVPLLEAGIPVHPVQLEYADAPGYLSDYDVLFLSYEGQKPPSPKCHEALRDWVHAGGVLVYLGDDTDPYHGVQEWWNEGQLNFRSPREHLFETLGLHPEAHPASEPCTHRTRTGGVVCQRICPASLAYRADGAEAVIDLARRACRRRNLRFESSNRIVVRRGPYVVAVGVTGERGAGPRAALEGGPFVDLFDASLPVVERVTLEPGDLRLLLDISAVAGPTDRVLCSGSRIYDQRRTRDEFRFTSRGPEGTMAATRVRLSTDPGVVAVAGRTPDQCTARWHRPTGTLLLKYPNRPLGQRVSISLAG